MPWIARRSVQFEALNSPLRSDLNNIILLSVLGCTKVDHFQSRKIVDYIRGRRKTSADLRRRPSSPLVICTLRRGSSGRRNPWLVYHRGIHHIYHLTGPQLILHRLRLLIAIHARGFALPFFAGRGLCRLSLRCRLCRRNHRRRGRQWCHFDNRADRISQGAINADPRGHRSDLRGTGRCHCLQLHSVSSGWVFRPWAGA
jgi:hypothetical protein